MRRGFGVWRSMVPGDGAGRRLRPAAQAPDEGAAPVGGTPDRTARLQAAAGWPTGRRAAPGGGGGGAASGGGGGGAV